MPDVVRTPLPKLPIMQTITINLPQSLRAQLQTFRSDQNIDHLEAAVVKALESYFLTWEPAKKIDPLPAMYNAEDGPCEVIDSFREEI
ncbi:hypothetical protein S7335_2018 [Synechococcus sp. PCC 7335]|nr:hypothetical protein S7335_2018 [Synechococcus sp. PCC 7335]